MRRTVVFLMFLAAAATLAGVAPGAAGAASLRLVAPAADTLVDQAKVLLILKIDGVGDFAQLEVIDNGKSVGFLPVKGAAAFSLLPLSEGSHDIAVAAPGMKRVAFKVARGKKPGYQYHAELPDLKSCLGCHPEMPVGSWGRPGGREVRDAKLCAGCHTLKEKGPFVHGPVAGEVCTPCHDPHGSVNPFFLVAKGKALCLGCHDQNLSAKHIVERKNADCLSCHDPHSSLKKFHLREAKK